MNSSSPPNTASLPSLLAEGVASGLQAIIEAKDSKEQEALDYLQYVEEKMIPQHQAFHLHFTIAEVLNKSTLKSAYQKDWPGLIEKCETEGSGFRNLDEKDFNEIIQINPKPLKKIFHKIIQEKIAGKKEKIFFGFCIKEGMIQSFPEIFFLFQQYHVDKFQVPVAINKLHAHEITNLMHNTSKLLDLDNIKQSNLFFFVYPHSYEATSLLILANLSMKMDLSKPLSSTTPAVYLIDFALLSGNSTIIRALSDLPYPFSLKDRLNQIAPSQAGNSNPRKISKNFPLFEESFLHHSIRFANTNYDQFLESMNLNRQTKVLSTIGSNEIELKSIDQIKPSQETTFYNMLAELLHEYHNFQFHERIQYLLEKIAASNIPAPSNQIELMILSKFFALILTELYPLLSIDFFKTILEKISPLHLNNLLTISNKTSPWHLQTKITDIRYGTLAGLLLEPSIFMSFCELMANLHFYEQALLRISQETSIAAVNELISKLPKTFLAEHIQKNPHCLQEIVQLGSKQNTPNELIKSLLSVAPFTQLQRASSFLKDEKNEAADLFDYYFYIEERKKGKNNPRLRLRVQYYAEIIDLFLAIYAGQTQRFPELLEKITEAIEQTKALSLSSIRLEPETNAKILRGLKISMGINANTPEEKIKNVQTMYAEFKGLPKVHYQANSRANPSQSSSSKPSTFETPTIR